MSDRFQLRAQPMIRITIDAYRSAEPTEDGSRGIVVFGETVLPVVDKAQIEIGSIGYSSEFVVIRDYRRSPAHETEYVIPIADIWRAFQDAQRQEDE